MGLLRRPAAFRASRKPGRRARSTPGLLEKSILPLRRLSHSPLPDLARKRPMMRGPVAQCPRFVQGPVGLHAIQALAMCKRSARCRPPERHLVVGPFPSIRRPPEPSNESRNPGENAAMIRCGSTRHPSRASPALALAIRSRAPLSKSALLLSCHASPYRLASFRFIMLRRAASSPCSGP